MSPFLKFLKRTKVIWSCVFAIGAILLILLVSAIKSESDSEYIKHDLLPLIRFVDAFREKNHRLPTTAEFRDWSDKAYENQLIVYYPDKPEFMSAWGKVGYDYVVGRWRGEWTEDYSSWDHKTFEDKGN